MVRSSYSPFIGNTIGKHQHLSISISFIVIYTLSIGITFTFLFATIFPSSGLLSREICWLETYQADQVQLERPECRCGQGEAEPQEEDGLQVLNSCLEVN